MSRSHTSQTQFQIFKEVKKENGKEYHYIIEINEVKGGIIKEMTLKKIYYPIPPYGNRIEYVTNIKFCEDNYDFIVEFKEVRHSWNGTGVYANDVIKFKTRDDYETPIYFDINELRNWIEEHGVKATIRDILEYVKDFTFQGESYE